MNPRGGKAMLFVQGASKDSKVEEVLHKPRTDPKPHPMIPTPSSVPAVSSASAADLEKVNREP